MTMDPIDSAKQSTLQEMELFLRNFSYVPDDKLDWRVSPTAKSSLRIAAHTALYMRRFAKMIRDPELPNLDHIDLWIAQRDTEEIAITTREEVEIAFRECVQEVISALESLTPEDLESVITSKNGGSVSLKYLITLPAWHTTVHLGQIDFLQTCWDDQKVYVD